MALIVFGRGFVLFTTHTHYNEYLPTHFDRLEGDSLDSLGGQESRPVLCITLYITKNHRQRSYGEVKEERTSRYSLRHDLLPQFVL